jgi:hypothetical protein
MNPNNPCVWNKKIDRIQCNICFQVDDCKILHPSKKVVDCVISLGKTTKATLRTAAVR